METVRKHPARIIPFDELWQSLQVAVTEGLVKEQTNNDGLYIFCYTEACAYERKWTDVTKVARGLILDSKSRQVVATPFPKFFNIGETSEPIPDLPFETFEKLDGSLIILFHHNGMWRCASRASLSSDQSKWATDWISKFDLSVLQPGTTYLAEAVYPENRILIHYDETGLMLLAAYEADGIEMPFDRLALVSERLGWRTAKRHQYGSVKELLAIAKKLPASEEGFVLRFSDGQRLKIKGEEYIRIHRMVSRLTPLSMWEAMYAGEDLETIRRQLPEEFWTDFDDITSILARQFHELIENIKAGAESVAGLTDKEVGMRLGEFSEEVKRFIFFYRKLNGDLLSDKRLRGSVFRTFRPDRNILEGYIPSYTINRLITEDA